MKIEKFKLSEIEISQMLLLTGGAIATAGNSTPIEPQSHWLLGDRERFITHDSDSVDDNGFVSFENRRITYGSWGGFWN